MPGGDYYPLADFSPWWAVIAAALVLLVAAWYAFVIWFPRWKHRPRGAAAIPEPAPWQRQQRISEHYLAEIDRVERDYADGRVDVRAAHVRLAEIVRRYTLEARGIPTLPMTLQELRQARLPELAEVVQGLYPSEFGAEASGSVRGSAQAARRAVTSAWN
jgi:hypothetical protein